MYLSAALILLLAKHLSTFSPPLSLQVTNMSEELAILEGCLKEAETGGDEQEDVCISDSAQTTTETAIQSLIEALRARDFSSALTQVKVFR